MKASYLAKNVAKLERWPFGRGKPENAFIAASGTAKIFGNIGEWPLREGPL